MIFEACRATIDTRRRPVVLGVASRRAGTALLVRACPVQVERLTGRTTWTGQARSSRLRRARGCRSRRASQSCPGPGRVALAAGGFPRVQGREVLPAGGMLMLLCDGGATVARTFEAHPSRGTNRRVQLKDSWPGGESRLAKIVADLAAQQRRMAEVLESPMVKFAADQAEQRRRTVEMVESPLAKFAADYAAQQRRMAEVLESPLAKFAADQAEQRRRTVEMVESPLAKFAADYAAQQRRMAEVLESPLAKFAADQAEQRRRMVEMLEPSVARIAGLDGLAARRFANVVEPRLMDLAGSLSAVVAQLPVDVARRTAGVSTAVVERVALDESGESVDQLASDVAATPGYEELWNEVQAEVEALLDESSLSTESIAAEDAASWHVSWLLFSLRTSLPSLTAVERISRIASVSAVAYIFCGVVRTGYPALWTELQELQLTPFDLLGYLFAVMVWAEVQRGKNEQPTTEN
jgi:hypothetical protein